MKLRRIVGSLLTLGISGALAVGAGVVPAAAEDVVPAEDYHWQLSPENAIIQPGESVTYTVILVNENGEPAEPQPAVVPYIGTDAPGDIEDGTTITAFSPGPRAVLAVGVENGVEYFGGTTLTVVGVPWSLTLTPSATTVAQGGSLTFQLAGVDEWGTPIDVSEAKLSSSVSSDVIDGMTVTFPTASPHTIYAQLGESFASVNVEVTPTAAPLTSSGSSDGLQLAATGFDGVVAVVLAGSLLVAGIAMTVFMRIRRTAS
jgi:hypothetical protein